MIRQFDNNGATLVEVVMVIMIMGILATVAIQSGISVVDTARVEETKQEMDNLAAAIVGRGQFPNAGTRSDFGYVGDVGSMPPDLGALVANPGSYATWSGPYVSDDLVQATGEYSSDAWGISYNYSGGHEIVSIGSGSSIVRRLANSTGDLLANQLSGNVIDAGGTLPDTLFSDSVTVILTHPDGVGGLATRTTSTDAGGYFSFGSVPIGVHDIRVVYEPDNDTIVRLATVLPASSPHLFLALAENEWYTSSGIPDLVAHYPLDETSGLIASDLSDDAYHADLQNDAIGAGWIPGKISNCFQFDGNDDYFETAVSDSNLQITADYTISVWIYAQATQQNWAAIACKCTPTGNDNHWTLQWDNRSGETKRLTIYHPSGGNWRSGYLLSDAKNAWHHIVITYQNSPARVTLYVDNVYHSHSTGLTRAPGSGDGKFRIGCDRTSYQWSGMIDDLRVFSRVITTDEINTLYEMGS